MRKAMLVAAMATLTLTMFGGTVFAAGNGKGRDTFAHALTKCAVEGKEPVLINLIGPDPASGNWFIDGVAGCDELDDTVISAEQAATVFKRGVCSTPTEVYPGFYDVICQVSPGKSAHRFQ